ncbi:TolC family protein [Thalassococcus sp. CAU 1522]|uniref:TolC family protein n=2 Tax=Thalassococcus arenae TaxID=2851652 RepID=A0ABS6N7Y0_9RHOB|nr:TolC family protein [Thalassococcus arenae]
MIAAIVVLPGCIKGTGDGVVSRFIGGPQVAAPQESAAQPAVARAEDASPIIAALQVRPTALTPGTAYARIADGVIASDARVAEAELRVARLRAEAARRNWLPRIGPRVSLNSLGDFVAELLINQVLFDNGRKQAERDLAKADVELAAVTLVEDGNARVFEALSLYLKAEEGRTRQAHYEVALRDMSQFEWVMQQRVEGGVSNMADLNVIRQKLASIRARQGEAQEAVTTAMAELNAMSAVPLDDVRGLSALQPVAAGRALAVLRAEAERDRTLAEARIARAGHLPGLSATGTLGKDGLSGGLEAGSDQLFGLGTMAELKALEATKLTAERRIGEADETARRQIASQSRQLEAFERQAAEAAALTASAKQNLDLFQRQYEGGQRQVMDVVNVYETYASALETEIDLKYRAARAALELARLRGALAEGARI